MIRLMMLFAAVAATCPYGLMAADKKAVDMQAAQDLLTAAARQTALLEDSDKPFVMDVDVTAKFDQMRRGHLRLRWEARDHWWSKVTVGPFEQVKLQNGEQSYTLSNTGFTPLQVTDLYVLLSPGKGFDKLVATKDKEHVESGAPVDCVEAKKQHEEVCINTSSHALVSRTWKSDSTVLQVRRFDDWSEFGGRSYPRRLQMDRNGMTVIMANVTDVREAALDPNLLTPPAGAIERRECPDKKMPVLIRDPDIGFGTVDMPSSGEDTMSVTVLADGTVGAVHVLESGGKAMDEGVISALKKAKFKPAMCGADAVVADIQWQMGYQRK
jgi:TonB family protein